jgi:hypothetical protein
LSELRDSYHSVNEKLAVVVDLVMAEGEPTALLEDECTTLMKELASGSRKQENEILTAMEDLCRRLMATKDEIAHLKNLLTRFQLRFPPPS